MSDYPNASERGHHQNASDREHWRTRIDAAQNDNRIRAREVLRLLRDHADSWTPDQGNEDDWPLRLLRGHLGAAERRGAKKAEAEVERLRKIESAARQAVLVWREWGSMCAELRASMHNLSDAYGPMRANINAKEGE